MSSAVSALRSILSVFASPNVILPSNVTLPCACISPNTSKLDLISNSPVPLNFKSMSVFVSLVSM